MMSYCRSPLHLTPSEDDIISPHTTKICTEGCGRSFSSSSSLHKHVRQVHRSQMEMVDRRVIFYHCPVSSCVYYINHPDRKHFISQKYLRQHFRKVHAWRGEKCDKCGKTFSTMSLLAVHQRSCGIELICECGFDTICLENLQTHVRRKGHAISQNTLAALRLSKMAHSNHKGSGAVPPSHQPVFRNSLNPVILQPASHKRMAAVALVELSSACIVQRPARVDIGIQTDIRCFRGQRRKSSSPSYSRETGRRRQTAETQTQLTNLNARRKQRNVLSKEAGTFMKKYNNSSQTSTTSRKCCEVNSPPLVKCGGKMVKTDLHNVRQAVCISSDLASMSCFDETEMVDSNTKFCNSDRSGNADCRIEIEMFEDDASNPCIGVNDINQLTRDPLEFSYHVIRDEMLNQDCLSDVETSSKNSTTSEYSGSSSIETQTETMMYTETLRPPPDEVIASNDGSPESLHDSLSHSFHMNHLDHLWCTSETQTCEDFCDIEQFLCSTIHTQTQEVPSELFPELSLCTAETKACCENSPTCVSSHTQTCV